VLDDGRHILLVAEGADRFARDIGISGCSGEELITERQRMRWERMTDTPGTVGAVAVDGAGGIAAATSTGGLLRKRPGRVGDSALIGAGTYADQLVGAACVAGPWACLYAGGFSQAPPISLGRRPSSSGWATPRDGGPR